MGCVPSKGLAAVMAAALLVIVLSCINQPTFESWYTGSLGWLPVSGPARAYLFNHYKFGHSLCYALFTLVFGGTCRPRLTWLLLVPFMLGVLLEGVQSFLPTRSGDWHDLLYNLAGILAGALLVAATGKLGKQT